MEELVSRREFIKTGVLAGLFGILPFTIEPELIIADIRFTEEFKKLLKFSSPYFKDGQGYVNVTIESISKMWETVRLVDENNNQWHTTDEGANWHCGKMSFSLDG